MAYDGKRRWNDSNLTRADMVAALQHSIEQSVETIRAEMETLRETARNEILIQIATVNATITEVNMELAGMKQEFEGHVKDEEKWEGRRWKFFIGFAVQAVLMALAFLLHLKGKL